MSQFRCVCGHRPDAPAVSDVREDVGMHDWRTVLSEVSEAHDRLSRTLESLDESAMRGPSALEGWTRGHVAHHIARNADSLWRLLEWARTGVENAQYPSGAFRDAEIEAGAGNSAADLCEDNRTASARFVQQALDLPEDRWDATVKTVSGWPHPAWYVLYRRWRETEVHHVDLAAGYTVNGWPTSYVRWELTDTLASLKAEKALEVSRATASDLGLTVDFPADGPALEAPGRTLLGWVTGRAPHSGTVAFPSWPLAPAVDWNHS